MPNKPNPQDIVWDTEDIEWDQPQIEQTSTKQPGLISEAISSYPSSAVEQLRGLWQAVKHPIKTGKTTLHMLRGFDVKARSLFDPRAFETATPEMRMDTKIADAVMEDYANVYGGLEQLEHTMRTDPARVTTDLAGLVGLFGGVTKFANLGPTANRIANVMIESGKFMEPVGQAQKIAGVGTKIVGKISKPIIGGLTGKGSESVSVAQRARPEFKSAIRGKVSGEEIVSTARTALDDMVEARYSEYVDNLLRIPQTRPLDIREVIRELNSQLGKFDIRTDTKGKIIRARIDRDQWSKIEQVMDAVKTHGSQPMDLTVMGFDGLKQLLDDFQDYVIDIGTIPFNCIADREGEFLTQQEWVKARPVPEEMKRDYMQEVLTQVIGGLPVNGRLDNLLSVKPSAKCQRGWMLV